MLLAFAICVAQLGFAAAPARAALDPGDKRVALVIGNANYRNIPALKNSGRDAALVAKSLRSVGFDVVEKNDLTRKSFESAVQQALSKAKGAGTVLFYFAGHGFQMNGRNYLVPTDAILKDRKKITEETLSLDDLIAELSAKDRQTIVFLDACRDNPIPSSARGEKVPEGLAQIETGSGLFVAFATQPGNVTADGKGDNSPFSDALATHIPAEGSSISDMMINVRNMVEEKTLHRQTPWDQSSLRSQFYFNPASEEESTEWSEEELAELESFAKANPAFLEKFKKSFRGLKVVQGAPEKNVEVASSRMTLRIEAADEEEPEAADEIPQTSEQADEAPDEQAIIEIASLPRQANSAPPAPVPADVKPPVKPMPPAAGPVGGASPAIAHSNGPSGQSAPLKLIVAAPVETDPAVVSGEMGARTSAPVPAVPAGKPGLRIMAGVESEPVPLPTDIADAAGPSREPSAKAAVPASSTVAAGQSGNVSPLDMLASASNDIPDMIPIPQPRPKFEPEMLMAALDTRPATTAPETRAAETVPTIPSAVIEAAPQVQVEITLPPITPLLPAPPIGMPMPEKAVTPTREPAVVAERATRVKHDDITKVPSTPLPPQKIERQMEMAALDTRLNEISPSAEIQRAIPPASLEKAVPATPARIETPPSRSIPAPVEPKASEIIGPGSPLAMPVTAPRFEAAVPDVIVPGPPLSMLLTPRFEPKAPEVIVLGPPLAMPAAPRFEPINNPSKLPELATSPLQKPDARPSAPDIAAAKPIPVLTPQITPPALQPVVPEKPIELAALQPAIVPTVAPAITPEPVPSLPPAVSLPALPPVILPNPGTQKRMATDVQKELARLGCYVGPFDGDWGSRSAKALLRYYTQKKVAPDDLEPTDDMIASLRDEPTVVCKTAPTKPPRPEIVDTPSKRNVAGSSPVAPRPANNRSTASASKPAAPAPEKLKSIKAMGVFR